MPLDGKANLDYQEIGRPYISQLEQRAAQYSHHYWAGIETQ